MGCVIIRGNIGEHKVYVILVGWFRVITMMLWGVFLAPFKSQRILSSYYFFFLNS